MIRRRVSAAVRLRDGFTGAPLSGGVLCTLDGQPLRPLWKEGGYLVLLDLPAGRHQLTLCRAGIQPAVLTVEAADGVLSEETVALRPGAGYPFPPETASLSVRLTARRGSLRGETLWAGLSGDVRLRLAQDAAAPGDTRVRLFCQGPEERLPLPGRFLAAGAGGAEIVALRALRGGVGELDTPLTLAQSRGTEWVSAQPWTVEEEGDVLVRFPRGGTVYLLCRGRWTRTEIRAGAQEFQWNPEGGT